MGEYRKSGEPRDYKERFEFELTVDGNIICQRYFRINNFNPACLKSYNLSDAVRFCVAVIDNDLKGKTQAYLETYAPMVFETKSEMEKFMAEPKNWPRFRTGHGIVVKGDSETDYVYVDDGRVKAIGSKFDDGELSERGVLDDGKATYRFAFKADGREVCVMEWDGYYPKFVRDKVDLSNKRGKFDKEEVGRLSFEQYVLYKMVEGRNDLIYGIIRRLCLACSNPHRDDYITDRDVMMSDWKASSDSILWRVL